MSRARATGALLALALAAAGGCGTSSNGVEAPAPGPAPPAACPADAPVALTVKNVLARCAVTIEGQAPSTAVAQTVCVPPRPVSLSATAVAGFRLPAAPWHGTDGDLGAGDAGTLSGSGPAAASAATITPTGPGSCAWACCALPDGTGCPASSQCP